MNPQSLALVQKCFQRECHSLLQYVSQADPWTSRKSHYLVKLVHDLAETEREGLARLAQWLLRHHVMPQGPASYPMSFTTINFTSLEHLLPYLVETEHKGIQDLKQAMAHVNDDSLKQLLQEYLQLKERHLHTLSAPAEPIAAAPTAHH